jgi:glutathione S-transferase
VEEIAEFIDRHPAHSLPDALRSALQLVWAEWWMFGHAYEVRPNSTGVSAPRTSRGGTGRNPVIKARVPEQIKNTLASL